MTPLTQLLSKNKMLIARAILHRGFAIALRLSMKMYLTPKRTGLRARSCAPANLIRDVTCLRVRRVIEIDTTLAVNVVDH